MVGSGPYRFLPPSSTRASVPRMNGSPAYVPRGEGTLSYTAGPKVTHFDRVEWQSLGDAATAVAALLQGEVDWLESPDRRPGAAARAQCRRDGGGQGSRPGRSRIMRFNHLHPPFNNPAIRRALLGAIDQADVMNAVAGTDRTYWHDRIGLFGPGSPLANEAGIEVLSGPRDYDKVKRDLEAAGYRGEPIVVLGVSGDWLYRRPYPRWAWTSCARPA